MQRRRTVRGSLFALAGGLLLFGGGVLHAQTGMIRGQVVDTAGEPVPEQQVTLHRVSAAGGAEVTRATSGSDGGFELQFEAADGDAIYFAATRHDGEVYMGEPFRAPREDAGGYTIVVGGESSLSALARAAGPRRTGPPRSVGSSGVAGTDASGEPWVFAAGALGAVLLILVGWWAYRRPPAARRLLVELADLEERHGGRDDVDADGRRAYERRREALRDRLRELVGT